MKKTRKWLKSLIVRASEKAVIEDEIRLANVRAYNELLANVGARPCGRPIPEPREIEEEDRYEVLAIPPNHKAEIEHIERLLKEAEASPLTRSEKDRCQGETTLKCRECTQYEAWSEAMEQHHQVSRING